MKVVILAGGRGTRLAEETEVRPKPMIEIGGHPILWHIIKHYEHHGFREFLLALGHKGEMIKRYFLDYYWLANGMTIDFATGEVQKHGDNEIDWIVNLQDTGQETATGGRLSRLRPCIEAGTFMLTYGDAVCDVDLRDVLRFHRSHGKIATVTAVRPLARFGGLICDGDLVSEFSEKSQNRVDWINGGYLAFEPTVFDYLEGNHTSLEADAMEQLAADRQLAAYRHRGFWQCMDTLREKRLLDRLWREGRAPWKVWA